MIFQYFTNPAPLVVVLNRLRERVCSIQLCAHFLQARSERFDLLLLLRDGRFLLFDLRLLLLILHAL